MKIKEKIKKQRLASVSELMSADKVQFATELVLIKTNYLASLCSETSKIASMSAFLSYKVIFTK